MADYSKHQKKIIERYYDQREAIMLTRLQELVSELYLAETDRKRDQLWKRVESAMKNLKIGPALAAHILAGRNPEVLARNVQDWIKSGPPRRDAAL